MVQDYQLISRYSYRFPGVHWQLCSRVDIQGWQEAVTERSPKTFTCCTPRAEPDPDGTRDWKSGPEG